MDNNIKDTEKWDNALKQWVNSPLAAPETLSETIIIKAQNLRQKTEIWSVWRNFVPQAKSIILATTACAVLGVGMTIWMQDKSTSDLEMSLSDSDAELAMLVGIED